MSDFDEAAPNTERAERAVTILSVLFGSALVAVAGLAAVQNRELLRIPDRNQLWGNFWKTQLAKPTGLPEFKPLKTEFSDVKFDATMLQPAFQVDPSMFQAPKKAAPRRSHKAPRRP